MCMYIHTDRQTAIHTSSKAERDNVSSAQSGVLRAFRRNTYVYTYIRITYIKQGWDAIYMYIRMIHTYIRITYIHMGAAAGRDTRHATHDTRHATRDMRHAT